MRFIARSKNKVVNRRKFMVYISVYPNINKILECNEKCSTISFEENDILFTWFNSSRAAIKAPFLKSTQPARSKVIVSRKEKPRTYAV